MATACTCYLLCHTWLRGRVAVDFWWVHVVYGASRTRTSVSVAVRLAAPGRSAPAAPCVAAAAGGGPPATSGLRAQSVCGCARVGCKRGACRRPRMAAHQPVSSATIIHLLFATRPASHGGQALVTPAGVCSAYACAVCCALLRGLGCVCPTSPLLLLLV